MRALSRSPSACTPPAHDAATTQPPTTVATSQTTVPEQQQQQMRRTAENPTLMMENSASDVAPLSPFLATEAPLFASHGRHTLPSSSPSHAAPPYHNQQQQQQQQHQTHLSVTGNTATSSAIHGIISFDNTKAGLQQVDKEKTEALIKELSQGSPFYANEQRKAEARERKVQEMLKKAKLFEQQIQNPHFAAMQQAEDGGSRRSPPMSSLLKATSKYEQMAQAVAAMEKELLFYGDECGLKQERVFVTMDLDAFYAACEEKKDPSLKLKPLAVGGNTMLSTTNYVARQYGVRSAMPGFIGRKLCPNLVIVPCDYAYYKNEAEAVRAIARQYDPDFTSGGWDELTMELSDYLRAKEEELREGSENEGEREKESPMTTQEKTDSASTNADENVGHTARMRRKYAAAERVVAEIRRKVTEVTQLTASAGIAPTATLAKIASNYNKPNGQHTLRLYTRRDVMAFMHGLPCRRVPGIGKSQEHILNGLGIQTVGDIYKNRVLLYHLITPKTFSFLLSASLGVGGMFHDEREGVSAGDGKRRLGEDHVGAGEDDESGEEEASYAGGWRKSVGQERTFYNLKSALEIEAIARQNLQDAVDSMKRKGLLARQMVLKLKHVNFQVRQHSRTISSPTDDWDVLQQTLHTLVAPIANSFADYRLLGVRLTMLMPKEQYQQLIEAERDAQGRHPQLTLMDFIGKRREKSKVAKTERKRGRDSTDSSVNSCFSISDESSDSERHEKAMKEEELLVESDDVQVVEEADVKLATPSTAAASEKDTKQHCTAKSFPPTQTASSLSVIEQLIPQKNTSVQSDT